MYLFELEMEPLITGGRAVFGEIRKYPPVYRHISLFAEEGVCAAEILRSIRDLAGPLLENVRLFDVYTGKGIPEGKRSLAFSLAYRDPEKTLRDEDVDEIHDKLRALLTEKGIKLR